MQAAASGQPDIDFAEEDESVQDQAREDLRGLVRNKPAAPQEVKREYALSSSGDRSGIHKNRAGFAKAGTAASCQFIMNGCKCGASGPGTHAPSEPNSLCTL